jgi:hypothetical protein
MEQVKVYYDPVGNTLPSAKDPVIDVGEERGDVVLMKDKHGRVIWLSYAAQPGTLRHLRL